MVKSSSLIFKASWFLVGLSRFLNRHFRCLVHRSLLHINRRRSIPQKRDEGGESFRISQNASPGRTLRGWLIKESSFQCSHYRFQCLAFCFFLDLSHDVFERIIPSDKAVVINSSVDSIPLRLCRSRWSGYWAHIQRPALPIFRTGKRAQDRSAKRPRTSRRRLRTYRNRASV